MAFNAKANIKKDPDTGKYVGSCKDLGIDVEGHSFEGCKFDLGDAVKKSFYERFSPRGEVELRETISCSVKFEIISAVNHTFDDFSPTSTEPSEEDLSPTSIDELEGRSEALPASDEAIPADFDYKDDLREETEPGVEDLGELEDYDPEQDIDIYPGCDEPEYPDQENSDESGLDVPVDALSSDYLGPETDAGPLPSDDPTEDEEFCATGVEVEEDEP